MSVGVCEPAIQVFFFFICVCLCQRGTLVSVCEAGKDNLQILVCLYLRQQFLFVCVCVCVLEVYDC